MHKIFFIGRNDAIVNEMERILCGIGYDILGFTSSLIDAKVLISDLRPDFVVIDFLVDDERNIHSFIDEIRGYEFNQSVFFLTYNKNESDIDSCEKLWIAFYPFKESHSKTKIKIKTGKNRGPSNIDLLEEKYINFSQSRDSMMCILGKDKCLISVNEIFCTFFEMELNDCIGTPFTDFIPDQYVESFFQKIGSLDPEMRIRQFVHPFQVKNNSSGWIEWMIHCVFGEDKEVVQYRMYGNGIPKNFSAYSMNQNEIFDLERKRKERALYLEERLIDMENVNTTLKVLLEKMHEDNMKIKEDIMTKIHELVIPYVNRLKEMSPEREWQAYLNIIENHLNELTSPFQMTLSGKYKCLTPSEIKIVQLVRQGKTAKEMADVLNMSSRTIESYRGSIRRKLGLTDRRIQLKAYLDSLTEELF